MCSANWKDVRDVDSDHSNDDAGGNISDTDSDNSAESGANHEDCCVCHGSRSLTQWISCDKCVECIGTVRWFHARCVGIRAMADELKETYKFWECDQC